MSYAPIIVFAFNRFNSLKACIESLLANSEALESNLIVFVDGPRCGKNSEVAKVDLVKDYVKSIVGFKSLTYYFSDVNLGLGPSVIEGVSKVVSNYGKAIIVEDDLILGKNFLSFMNQGLNLYEKEKMIFSICGYTNRLAIPKDYYLDAYFCPRSSSWGWATWKDRWDKCDWELKDWKSVKMNAKAFNKWGGSDCYSMLKAWRKGKNQSWAIRFCYNQFIHNRQSLFPIISHVKNNGFDGDGTNCPHWNRFKSDFDVTENKNFNFPVDVVVDKRLRKSAMSYHSIFFRVYGKLRNAFMK